MPVADEGLEAAETRAEEAKTSAFHKVPFLKIDDGSPKPVFIRFIDHRTYTFDMHGGIPTKAKPAEIKEGSWPKMMWAVCQNGKPFRVRDAEGNITEEFEPGYGDCHIHRIMKGVPNTPYKGDKAAPRVQTFGIAVLQEPVRDPSTKAVTGFRDVMEEFKNEAGDTWQVPKMVLVQQTYSNFWSPLKAQMYMGSGRITDWVFGISRKENTYTFSAKETPNVTPDAPAWAKYAQLLEVTGYDLWKQLLEWADPEWYKRWFIEGAVPEGGYGRKDDDSAETDGAAATAAAEPPEEPPGTYFSFNGFSTLP